MIILDLRLWPLNPNSGVLMFLFGLFDLLLLLLGFLLLLPPPGGLPVKPLLLDFRRSFLNPFFDVGMPSMAEKELANIRLVCNRNLIPLIFGHKERLLLIFFGQYPVVRIRHLRNNTLVHALSHRIQIRGLVMMVVLA